MPNHKKKTPKTPIAPVAAVAPKSLTPVITNAPDFKSLYTNFAQSGFTGFDIYVIFGEAAGPNPDGTMPVEMKAKVTMTPVEAKLVALIIAASVQKYEAQFGKITVPKGLGVEGVPGVAPPAEGV